VNVQREARISSVAKTLCWMVPALLVACASAQGGKAAAPRAGGPEFRLELCGEHPLRLEGPPGAQQSRGCVARFHQELTDEATRARLGVSQLERRYLVYVPEGLATAGLAAPPAPVVFVFPGSTASAEVAAFYYTQTRFEALADRDGFIVVYGNGVPEAHASDGQVATAQGGFLPACLVQHEGEGFDVTYVRMILSQLEAELSVDRSRIYATGLSQGGGMSRPSRPLRRFPFSLADRGSILVTPSPATNRCRSRYSPPPVTDLFPTLQVARPSTRTPTTPAWKKRGTRGSRRFPFRGRPQSMPYPTW
jgi:hypothetical protein